MGPRRSGQLLTLGETLVTGRALVRYEIQNAPVKEFPAQDPGRVQERGDQRRQHPSQRSNW